MYMKIEAFPQDAVTAIYTNKGRGDWFYHGGQGKAIDNYKALSDQLGIPMDRMVRPIETHTAKVAVVTEAVGGDGILRESRFGDCDGLITNERHLALCMLQSDCPPIYFYDPVQQAIGLVHSGRRGTEANIAGNALELLNRTYGSLPENLIAAIGPHICGKCYEVDSVTAENFAACFPEELRHLIIHEKEDRRIIDLEEAIVCQLLHAGLRQEHIFRSASCTLEKNTLYSYRGGDGILSGLALIMLKDGPVTCFPLSGRTGL